MLQQLKNVFGLKNQFEMQDSPLNIKMEFIIHSFSVLNQLA